MAFHETRFPTGIAFGSSGGPARKTEIVTLGSGFEERNAVWANSRRRYDVGYGVRSLDDIHAVIGFFEARMGRLYGFRFKDFADFKSCAPNVAVAAGDSIIGSGNGTATEFSLAKLYSSGAGSWTRAIKKPVAGTVRVALNGVEAMSGWSVDTTMGVVTFVSAPASGVIITAGFEFDVPVRFDTDYLEVDLSAFAAGAIPKIPLVEIKV
ncbi:MAG TPA: DUF2460 domain-containing protein [Micropepsaceae bacterium]|nr:DUF2460 domain-containing protein [Micropepsaceae bacterium]